MEGDCPHSIAKTWKKITFKEDRVGNKRISTSKIYHFS